MFFNYLKITFRSLWKSKLFVIINILGMGIAIGCCIVGYLNYDFNTSWDATQNTDGIYRVDIIRETQRGAQLYGMSPLPLGEIIDENFGDVDAKMRYMPSGGNFKVLDELYAENFTFVDPNFFELFNFDFIVGSKSALADKSSIIISDELATKYFGKEEAIGQTMTHLTNDGPKNYIVRGVFKQMPLNSSFSYVKTITNIENYFDLQSEDIKQDWSVWTTLFVKVDDPGRIALIEKRLEDYIEIQNKARLDFKVERYQLEPIKGMASRSANEEVYGHWLSESLPPPAVVVPSVMAILILLIACFNFTNTSIAISSKRLKEIGLRKVMGGLRSQLVIQFLMENVMLCFMATLVGLIIAFFLVPAYSEMWPFLELNFDFYTNGMFFLFLSIVLLFTGLIAGSYPAFYISGFEPASILKGTQKFGGSGKLTSVLLTLQFLISLMSIIFGVVFYQNANYQEEMDYGFDKNGAISLYINNEDDFKAYQNAISKDSRILSTAGSEHQVGRSYRNDPVKNADKEFDVDIFHVGENFMETMDFTILEGRGFQKDSETDFQESVLVSEEMVKVFGWQNPIGQKITWMDTVQYYVIGVTKNAFLEGLWNPLEPMMLRYVPESKYEFLSVKADQKDLLAVNEFLEDEWKILFPDKMYTGSYLDAQMGDSALINSNIIKLFGFLGVVATLLSAIGLFSLVSLSIVKRLKEIGVRKVMGASISNLMVILNKRFFIVLMIAMVLGSAVSYFLVIIMMESIWKYHATPGAISFLVSAAVLFVVAGCTVGFKVFNAASMNPVNTLRSE